MNGGSNITDRTLLSVRGGSAGIRFHYMRMERFDVEAMLGCGKVLVELAVTVSQVGINAMRAMQSHDVAQDFTLIERERLHNG